MELANKLAAVSPLIVGDNEIATGNLCPERYGVGRANNFDPPAIARTARQLNGKHGNNSQICEVTLIFWAILRRTHSCGELRATDAANAPS